MARAAVPVPDIEIILAMQRLLRRQVLCVGSAAMARCEHWIDWTF